MGAPLRKLSGDPECKNGTCPTLWGTDDGNDYVVQGYVINDPEQAVQLDRLVSLSRLPNVTVVVVPLAGRMPDFPMTCFSLHDDRLVIVETFHSEITTRDPRDVQTYVDTFHRFAGVSLSDSLG
ncbi:Scr1 family TA system antitoxin-like transcriptional regulator [Streptomyces sp. NPDC051104]|uniref:Scr1 family TA system antitoxin-like transcriptional regulator n=1 Tax=Streptomyces sp. NPDC051104 TaxID=3155044 RepID=UPI00341D75EF